MSMTREALEYVVGLSEAQVTEVDGVNYADKPLYEIKENIPMAEPLCINTLTSLVDYIKSGVDEMRGKMIIVVTDPKRVKLYSQLNERRNREFLISVEAMLPYIDYDHFLSHEEFIIGLQSKFEISKERDMLIKFVGTVEGGTVAQYGDDGVTQKATVKTGLTSKAETLVPNPVKLRPYRTFLELEQPESEFIFRMREGEGVSCALFEADGGAWKYDAMQKIKTWLEEQLKDVDGFTVIA